MFSRAFGRRPREPRPPRLSVVVPVYNAEEYLAECLDSILSQEFSDLEIVVVDDGSTDASAAVAQEYALRHAHVTFVSSVNQGPGLARNLGVQHCRGEYLAFADADDTVSPGAYRLLVSTLTDSGSDFVVGSLRRHVNGELVEPPFLSSAHRRRRVAIRIDDLPEILRNVFVWDKVFRRSFWDSFRLAFPAGMMGEDQVAMTEAYLRAAAFDVVPEPVYLWHTRGAGSSITQRRHQLADLRDRIATKQQTSDLVSALGSEKVREYWARNGLGGDLPLYFRHIPGCDDDYWHTLVAGVRQLFTDQPPIHESYLLRVQQRLIGWLVTRDRRAEAETVVRWLEQHPGSLPVQPQDGHVVAQLPFHDDPDSGIPSQLFWLAAHELRFDARLWQVTWEHDHLIVTGAIVVRGAPTTGVPCSISAVLRSESGHRLPMAIESRPTPEVTRWVDRFPQRYDEGGFVGRISAGELSDSASRAGSQWQLLLSVDVAGIRRNGPFRSKAADIELPVRSSRVSGLALSASFRPGLGLVITPSPDGE